MASNTSFPSYLTSGSTSRAQYALVSALERLDTLNDKADRKEARRTCDLEVRRVKERWADDGRVSESQTVKDLLLLQQIHTLRPTTRTTNNSDPLAFSYIPALTLLEHSSSLSNRRTALLYLSEVLPSYITLLTPDLDTAGRPTSSSQTKTKTKSEEIIFLTTNTIRKDLASRDPGWILLGLSAVIRFGRMLVGDRGERRELFEGLLGSGRLKGHESSLVRLRTAHAWAALDQIHGHASASPHTSPAPATRTPTSNHRDQIQNILDQLSTETDPSIISILLRRLQKSSCGAFKPSTSDSPQAGRAKREVVLQAISDRLNEKIGKVHLDLIRVMPYLERSEEQKHVVGMDGSSWVKEAELRLGGMVERREMLGWNAAYLNEVVQIMREADHAQLGNLPSIILSGVQIVLNANRLSKHTSRSLSSTRHPRDRTTLDPNMHILALRCLSVLPTGAWDDQLSAEEMELIMSGVEAMDKEIRLLTLKLLVQLDIQLLCLQFDRLLQAMRGSNESEHAAERAIEVLTIQVANPGDLPEQVEELAQRVWSWAQVAAEVEVDLSEADIAAAVANLLGHDDKVVDELKLALLGLMDMDDQTKDRTTALQVAVRSAIGMESVVDLKNLHIT